MLQGTSFDIKYPLVPVLKDKDRYVSLHLHQFVKKAVTFRNVVKHADNLRIVSLRLK